MRACRVIYFLFIFLLEVGDAFGGAFLLNYWIMYFLMYSPDQRWVMHYHWIIQLSMFFITEVFNYSRIFIQVFTYPCSVSLHYSIIHPKKEHNRNPPPHSYICHIIILLLYMSHHHSCKERTKSQPAASRHCFRSRRQRRARAACGEWWRWMCPISAALLHLPPRCLPHLHDDVTYIIVIWWCDSPTASSATLFTTPVTSSLYMSHHHECVQYQQPYCVFRHVVYHTCMMMWHI